MVALFVVVTILIMLTVDYVVQKRQVAHAKATAQNNIVTSNAENLDLSSIPNGLFLDKGFAWTELIKNGELRLGVSEMPLYALGEVTDVELLAEGTSIKKGEPLARITRNDRTFVLRSPMDGKITEANMDVFNETEIMTHEPYEQGWLYKMKPDEITSVFSSMMIGDKATSWLKTEVGKFRDFLTSAVSANPAFATMQDGGVPVKGFSEYLTEDEWGNLSDWLSNPERS